MGIIAWIIIGLLAGAIAKAIVPGKQGGGIVSTLLLGVVGGIVGGLIGGAISGEGLTGFTLWSLLLAVAGSVLVLFAWEFLTKRMGAGHHLGRRRTV
ncbi:MAG TPA: GlsB/YeaQ/YmgE family stress response membrane protein [Vulgatibacter sp.]|nr:GlsB/YeaQ/YmgE family stress response membrane protein [Vulgatibacter sp.]